MMRLALIGKGIDHSRSPQIYRHLLSGSVDYHLLDYQSESEIPSAKELLLDYHGISVTSPYKLHFLEEVIAEDSVKHAGAINCLFNRPDGKVGGHNTDYLALKMLIPHYLDQYGLDHLVILGAGVMARVVKQICLEFAIPHQWLTRASHGDLSTIDLRGLGHPASLIVNCCDRSMRFFGSFLAQDVFFDLNYSLTHPFWGELNAFRYIDGAEMLTLQAKLALEFWKLLPEKNS